MIFRRKKKRVDDDNQLLLFTMEEMKGGEELSSQPVVTPSITTIDENLPEESEKESIPITDNRYSADHQLLLESMRKAILRLSTLNINDIRLIAIESATLAQGGINTEHTYSLQALGEKELSGYDFIAYYYVSFARSFPTMLDKIDLPFSDIYEEALSLGK